MSQTTVRRISRRGAVKSLGAVAALGLGTMGQAEANNGHELDAWAITVCAEGIETRLNLATAGKTFC